MSDVGGARLALPGTQVLPRAGAPDLPDGLSARSWVLADAESGEVLAAHDAHRPLPPASTVKMLLADTLLPQFDREDLYRARPEHFAELGPGSSAVGLADYQTYTVEDLWLGVFLASGNDAAHALATMNGGVEATVREMNERAAELQAYDTHVVNPDGYDAPGQLSSAYDLTLIARSGMQNADFREYAATPAFDFPGAGEGEDRETFEIQSTNRLLTGDSGLDPYPGIAGIKNGYTTAAGYTFTGVAERDGEVLLVTVMDPVGDSLEVYREAAELLDWGFGASGMVEPVGELVPPLSEAGEEGPAGEAGRPGPEVDSDDSDGSDDGGGSGGDGSDGEAGGTGEAGDSGQAALEGAASGGEDGAASGVTVLATAVAGLLVLGTAAFIFHRRHPLPLAVAARGRSRNRPPSGPLPWRRHRDGPAD